MIEQIDSPTGISVYCRKDGTVLKTSSGKVDLLVYYKGKRFRFLSRVKGDGPWTNNDNQLWCLVLPEKLFGWSDEE